MTWETVFVYALVLGAVAVAGDGDEVPGAGGGREADDRSPGRGRPLRHREPG